MAHEELIARLRSMNTVTGDWAACELEATDRQAEADRARIAALEKAVRDTEEMRGATIRDLEHYKEQLDAANQRIADWERRSESCESKLGQLEANEALIEANQRIAELESVIRSHGIPVKTATGGQAHYCTSDATERKITLLRRVKELREALEKRMASENRWPDYIQEALATEDDFSGLEDQPRPSA